jgi:hypothetical protein
MDGGLDWWMYESIEDDKAMTKQQTSKQFKAI